jgi:hypothetical protein
MAEKKSKLEAAEARYWKLYKEYQDLREKVAEAKAARDAALIAEQEAAVARTGVTPERMDGIAVIE